MKNFQKRSIFSRKNLEKGKKWGIFQKFIFFVLGLAALSTVIVGVVVWNFMQELPDIQKIDEIVFAQSSIIYDRNGVELYTLHGDENRKNISLDQIPSHLIDATLAIEDSDFFDHAGFSFKGIIYAVFSEVLNFGQHKRGGSTLTQQFIKNTFLTSEKTYSRKIKELILSVQLEWRFSKNEILNMYLNSIPYGANAYGAEQASLTFFGKSVSEVSLVESAILASVPNAPTRYSPYGDYVRTKINRPIDEIQALDVDNYSDFLDQLEDDDISIGLLPLKVTLENGSEMVISGRSSLVIKRMYDLGFISEKQESDSLAELLTYTFNSRRTEIKAPHFVMYIRKLLEEKYGKELLQAGGLKIITTLDYSLQEKSEEIVTAQGDINATKYNAKNAAAMTIRPSSGEILAMVGSRDYWNDEIDGKVNIMLQRRLPGSSFKPFAYAAAFLKGYSPGSVVYDVETDFGDGYTPQNFDGAFRGPISLRRALGGSLNVPAVKSGILGGLQTTYDISKGMGISYLKEADWYGAALPLGVSEVRPYDMAQAYSVFAMNGQKVPLVSILKIVDRNGNVLEEFSEPESHEVLHPQTAYLITDILSDASARGPGWNAYLQLPNRKNAVKTGTSNKKKDDVIQPFDAWTIGYTAQYLTVVWAGNNDGSVMNSRGSGYGAAAPIWRKIMIAVHEDVVAEPFVKPAGMKTALVSKLSGKLPGPDTPKDIVIQEIFSSLNIPRTYDNSLEFFEVDRLSGDLPNEYTPDEAKKKVALVQWVSTKPGRADWQDPVNEWGEEHGEAFLAKLGVEGIVMKKPEKISVIHTEESAKNPPSITITSPVSHGIVGRDFGVWVDINAKNGVAFVEFFVDGKKVETMTAPPYKASIHLDTSIKIGESVEVMVKIYDTLYSASSSSIEVKLGEDNQPPHTEIIFPAAGQSFSKDSSIIVETYTYDVRSDIQKVEFFLDDTKMAEITTAPYNGSVVLSVEPGEYAIRVRAFDSSSQMSEDLIPITVTAQKKTQDFSLQMKASLESGESNLLKFYLPEVYVENTEKIVLKARYKSEQGDVKKELIVTEFHGSPLVAGEYQYNWKSPEVGEYSLFIDAIKKDGSHKYSPRKVFTVSQKQ